MDVPASGGRRVDCAVPRGRFGTAPSVTFDAPSGGPAAPAAGPPRPAGAGLGPVLVRSRAWSGAPTGSGALRPAGSGAARW